jgi:hypothetical protein
MIAVFVGDTALYHDQENLCFLRCYISEVLRSGDVMVHFMDEGFTKLVEPSTLYQLPLKLRKIEPLSLKFSMRNKDNSELEEEQVSYCEALLI